MKTLSYLASASRVYLGEDFKDQVSQSATNLYSVGASLDKYIEKLRTYLSKLKTTKIEPYRLDLEDLAKLKDRTFGEKVDDWLNNNSPPEAEAGFLLRNSKQTIEGLVSLGVAPAKLEKAKKALAVLVSSLLKKENVSVAALAIMNSLKSVARRKAFDNANLGEYDPSNPIIKRLVSLGLVSIKGGKMIVPTDWVEIEVVLAPYKIPVGLI